MNWVGGSKARNGLLGQNGDIQRRYLNFATIMEEDDLTQEENPSQRQRTVPLLQFMKENFEHGEALAVQLSHQLEITKTHYKQRIGSVQSSQSQYQQQQQSTW